MFKLINKDDAKVFAGSKFIKNADYFKDAFAFFDAYSLLCEKQTTDLPSYCVYDDGSLCLEGVCLFLKSYAAEFGFKTIDLSIDYLKILYYSISALSKDFETVSRGLLDNEYLVYKNANIKYFEKVKAEFDQVEKVHKGNVEKFNNSNNKHAKYFMSARILDILATVIIIFSFLFAIFPVSFYLVERLALKNAVVYSVAILLIGLILKIQLKIYVKYLSDMAMDEAYKLQTLKINKNDSLKIFEEFKVKNSKIVCEYYGFSSKLIAASFDFDSILALAKKSEFKFVNLRQDVLEKEKNIQDEIYDVVDRILRVQATDYGRFENLYNEINSKDHLKFNKLIRFNFVDKFIDCAKVSKNWKLDLNNSQVDPFDIDAKQVANEKIKFLTNDNSKTLEMSLNSFLDSKIAKKQRSMQLKNIKDEYSFNNAKMEYINHFDEKIPELFELKFDIIKNRVICNSLGEDVFFKLKNIINDYEKANEKDVVKESDSATDVVEAENQEIRNLFECDEVLDLGNGEVLCKVDDQAFKGFRLTNI